jgi:hypothetical protein
MEACWLDWIPQYFIWQRHLDALLHINKISCYSTVQPASVLIPTVTIRRKSVLIIFSRPFPQLMCFCFSAIFKDIVPLIMSLEQLFIVIKTKQASVLWTSMTSITYSSRISCVRSKSLFSRKHYLMGEFTALFEHRLCRDQQIVFNIRVCPETLVSCLFTSALFLPYVKSIFSCHRCMQGLPMRH